MHRLLAEQPCDLLRTDLHHPAREQLPRRLAGELRDRLAGDAFVDECVRVEPRVGEVLHQLVREPLARRIAGAVRAVLRDQQHLTRR